MYLLINTYIYIHYTLIMENQIDYDIRIGTDDYEINYAIRNEIRKSVMLTLVQRVALGTLDNIAQWSKFLKITEVNR